MDAQRLRDRIPGPHAWVERAVGILEDHLHAAAQGTQLRLRRVRDVDAVEPDLAGVGFDQANDHPGERRLPATALADDAERLARPQAQRRVLDGEYGGKRAPRAALLRKAFAQADRFEERRSFVHGATAELGNQQAAR